MKKHNVLVALAVLALSLSACGASAADSEAAANNTDEVVDIAAPSSESTEEAGESVSLASDEPAATESADPAANDDPWINDYHLVDDTGAAMYLSISRDTGDVYSFDFDIYQFVEFVGTAISEDDHLALAGNCDGDPNFHIQAVFSDEGDHYLLTITDSTMDLLEEGQSWEFQIGTDPRIAAEEEAQTTESEPVEEEAQATESEPAGEDIPGVPYVAYSMSVIGIPLDSFKEAVGATGPGACQQAEMDSTQFGLINSDGSMTMYVFPKTKEYIGVRDGQISAYSSYNNGTNIRYTIPEELMLTEPLFICGGSYFNLIWHLENCYYSVRGYGRGREIGQFDDTMYDCKMMSVALAENPEDLYYLAEYIAENPAPNRDAY